MLQYEVPVLEGVEASLEGGKLTVKGPKGELNRQFRHHEIKLSVKDGNIILSTESERRKVKALMGTWKAHFKNMMQGVVKGFECNMKLVYAHFPVKLEVHDNVLMIKNFLGGRSSRSAKILDGVEIKLEGDSVKLTGADKEMVGQSAANIEQATHVKGYDRRVFQDGIYITQKPMPQGEGG